MTTGLVPGTIPGGAHTATHGIIVPGGLLTTILGIMIPGTGIPGTTTCGISAALIGTVHTGLLRSTMIHGITVTTTGLTAPTTMALTTATVTAGTTVAAITSVISEGEVLTT